MHTLTKIDGAMAFVRKKGGVFQQVALYARGNLVFFPAAGGYVQVRGQQHDGTFATSHPDITLLEHDDHDALTLVGSIGVKNLRYAPAKAAPAS